MEQVRQLAGEYGYNMPFWLSVGLAVVLGLGGPLLLSAGIGKGAKTVQALAIRDVRRFAERLQHHWQLPPMRAVWIIPSTLLLLVLIVPIVLWLSFLGFQMIRADGRRLLTLNEFLGLERGVVWGYFAASGMSLTLALSSAWVVTTRAFGLTWASDSIDAVRHPEGLVTWREFWDRNGYMLVHSAYLLAATLAFLSPVGVAVAFRTNPTLGATLLAVVLSIFYAPLIARIGIAKLLSKNWRARLILILSGLTLTTLSVLVQASL